LTVANPPEVGRLSRGQRAAVVLFAVGFALWGAFVEKRSAFMQRRMGDVGVYFRAGWAVRQGGGSLYEFTDDNGWHYCYPPAFAVLMAPLADPPPGADAAGMLPYPVLVAIFYLLSVAALALGVHLLASALEQASPTPAIHGQPAGSLRWWRLRIWPVLICLPPIGHTLVRGQANMFLLLAVCGLAAALMRGHRLRAGLWLAAAACLKIFPAYLLLVPLWRRDLRCHVGCLIGLVVGLVAIPVAALGPAQTARCYRQLTEGLIRPALAAGGDDSRAKELIEQTATDSQSFVTALHNSLNLERSTRPDNASPAVRRAHWALGAGFTLLTLAAAWLQRQRAGATGPPWREAGLPVALLVGALTLIMLLSCPVCHTHYFALELVLVMALLARSWDRSGDSRLTPGMLALSAVLMAGNILPLLPSLLVLKEVGAAMYAAVLLHLVGCAALAGYRPAAARAAGPRRAAVDLGRGAA
jgi:hypothetical protein